MTYRSIALAGLCVLLGACSAARDQAADNAFPLDVLKGDWGWEGTEDCRQGPLHFRFAGSAQRMFLSHLTEGPDGRKGPPRIDTAYSVLGGSADRLKLRMDPPKHSKDAQPEDWDLVLLDENTYCWHRTDWPETGCTKPVRRCGSGQGR